MTICYVAPFVEVPNTSGYGTGGSAHAIDVAVALQSLGVSVELVCASNTAGSQGALVDGVRTWPLLDPITPGLGTRKPAKAGSALRALGASTYRWMRSIGHARQIRRICQETKARLVYERANAADFGGTLAAMSLGLPLVIELNDFNWKPLSANRAVAGVAPSIDELPPALQRKSLKLPWGVSPARFSATTPRVQIEEFRDSDAVLVHASSCLPWHGAVETVSALAMLSGRYPALRLLLVGGGPTLDEARRLARIHDIEDRVKFTGHVPYEHMASYLNAACIGLAPYDGTLSGDRARLAVPFKVLEYLSCGKPCIVSENANLAGIVTQEVGWEIPSAEPSHIADGIVRALQSRGQWRSMGKSGSMKVAAEYSWTAHATKLAELFDRVSEHPVSPR